MDVEAVEPDIRGATTIREQLAKHRQRRRVRELPRQDRSAGLRPGELRRHRRLARPLPERRQRRTGGRERPHDAVSRRARRWTPPTCCRTAGSFKNIDEYKQLLLKDKDQLARALAEKLLTYATGGAPTTADQPEIEAIVARIRAKNYGFRSLVHEIVQSKMFQTQVTAQPSIRSCIDHRGVSMTLHRRTLPPRRRRLAGLALARRLLAAQPRGRTPQPRRRMVCICTPLGLHPPYFFPEKAGKDYELTPYLEVLKDFRDDFTVISGLSHAGMSPGFAHQASASFLTGVPGAGRPGFRNAISLDQFAAEHIGGQTRFPSLALSGEGRRPVLDPHRRARARGHLAVAGVRQAVPRRPARRSPGPGAPPRRRPEHPRRRPRPGRQRCGPTSAPTIATSSTSTSPASASWSSGWPGTKPGPRRPSPRSMSQPPKDIPNAADLIGRTRLLFDLTHLALQTDSTRLITIMLAGSTYVPPIPGVTLGHHDLSHHGKDPGKLAQLKIVEVGDDEDRARPARQAEADARRTAPACSTGRWSSSAATWATAAATPSRTCRSSWPAAASGTASTCPSIRRTRRRCAIST